MFPKRLPLVLLLTLACNQIPKTDPDDTGTPATDDPTEDADQDGWNAAEDCDDEDARINPGADEDVDDSVDNDCDGWVDELDVCEDAAYNSIHDAVHAVAHGGLILVCPGTWYENITLGSEGFTIIARDGPATTILDGSGERIWNLSDIQDPGLSIQGFTLTNGSPGDSGHGGAVRCADSRLELVGNVFTGNSGKDGAAAYTRDCAVDFRGNQFLDNTVDGWGGAIYLETSTGTLQGNTVGRNSADHGGGIAVIGGNPTLLDNLIHDNQAVYYGGGLWSDADILIEGNTFSDNISDDDGGGAFLEYAGGDFRGNILEGNRCHADGGGLYTSISTVTISDNTFTANEAEDDGGGLRVYFGSSVIENNTFSHNTAANDGGGTKISHSSTNLLRDNLWENNEALDEGGGLEMDNDASPVQGATFRGNRALRGGGLHSWANEHNMELQDLTFDGNEASECGGGMTLNNDSHLVHVHNAVFDGNSAPQGGALCADDFQGVGVNLRLDAIVLAGNQADAEGGALFLQSSQSDVRNTVFWRNEAPSGAGVYTSGGSAALVNTIFSDQDGDNTASSAALLTATYSDFADGAALGGTGNLSVDPDFQDASGGDFSLQAGSPCIDKGSPSMSDPDGSRSDMGAFGGEYGGW